MLRSRKTRPSIRSSIPPSNPQTPKQEEEGSHGLLPLPHKPLPPALPTSPPPLPLQEAQRPRRLPLQILLGLAPHHQHHPVPAFPSPPKAIHVHLARGVLREGRQDEDPQGLGEAVPGDGEGQDRAAARGEAAPARKEEHQAQEEAVQDGPS